MTAASDFVCALDSSVFGSRVNDGVCDCCDGTDEWRGNVQCTNSCFQHDLIIRACALVGPALLSIGLMWLPCISHCRTTRALGFFSLLGVAVPPVLLTKTTSDWSALATFGALALASHAATILSTLLNATGYSLTAPPIVLLLCGAGLVHAAVGRALLTHASSTALLFGACACVGNLQAVALLRQNAAGMLRALLPLLLLPLALLLAATCWAVSPTQAKAARNLAAFLAAAAMLVGARLRSQSKPLVQGFLLLTCFHGLTVMSSYGAMRELFITADLVPLIGSGLALGSLACAGQAVHTSTSLSVEGLVASAAVAQLPMTLFAAQADWLLILAIAAAASACTAVLLLYWFEPHLRQHRASGFSAACISAVAWRGALDAQAPWSFMALAVFIGPTLATVASPASVHFMSLLKKTENAVAMVAANARREREYDDGDEEYEEEDNDNEEHWHED